VGGRVSVTPVQIAVASAPLAGETESGDAAVVFELPGGTLVAAVDGLGHGPQAAAAARAVTDAVAAAPSAPLQQIVQRCHLAATTTRGAALTLAWFHADRPHMSWLAVGNVAGVLVHRASQRRETVVSRPGIVGAALPPLHPGEVELEDGDTLVLATDGLTVGFAKAVQPHMAPQASADRLLADWSRGSDDALVLVARYARTG
jgi:negative regulator of sigma-B (phosphoserine phosphatase)